jgi:hypothetical protein
LKIGIGVAAGLMLLLSPEFAVLLFFLCVFWEELGDLTLEAYDDYQVTKTDKALKGSLSANVKGYYVHALTMRSMAERERRSRAKVARQRRIHAASTAIARVSTRVRLLIQGAGTVPMRAANEEE